MGNNQQGQHRTGRNSGKENGIDDLTNFAFLPPHNPELEKAVLGVVLLESSGFEIAADVLFEDCFYENNHKIIWKACHDIHNKGYNIDVFVIIDELTKSALIDEAGGKFYLMELIKDVVNSANLHQWCLVIYEKYQYREMIRLCRETISNSTQGMDIFELMEDHERKLTQIMQGNSFTPSKNSMDLLMEIDGDLAKMQIEQKSVIGLKTGFPQLDATLSGMREGNVIYIGARPAIGKSSFAMNLAVNMAELNDAAGQIFTLEMPGKEYMYRIAANISQVDMNKIMRGKMDANDLIKYENAKRKISKLRLFFDDTAGINISQLRTIARKAVMHKGVKFIIVDYLQIMGSIPGMKFATRDLELGYTSSQLKILAKELNIPIIALCQLSRGLESRSNKKPILSDLRESGNYEQDADVVILMSSSGDGFVNFDIAKNRNGKTDEFSLAVDFSIQKFFHRDSFIDFKGLNQNISRFSPMEGENDDLPF